MDQALIDSMVYNNHVIYNIIKTFSYDSKNDFNTIVNGFKDDISIRTYFGNPSNNICYDIFEAIGYYYDKLLIKELDSLLIVNRNGDAIKIHRNITCKKNIGIINIDAVLSEMNINNYNKKGWLSYIYITGFVGLICIGVGRYRDCNFIGEVFKK